MNLKLEKMVITNQTHEALFWEKAGVDLIFIDLEHLGKAERQGHVDSVKSQHDVNDVAQISRALTSAQTLVRLNPINDHTVEEVETVIENGADILMLPMFTEPTQINELARMVDGRCELYPLIETPEAVMQAEELSRLTCVQGYHFGLNDLHLALNMGFMFEVLLWPEFLRAVQLFHDTDVFYGIGGVSRIGTGYLEADVIVRELYRLGAQRVILSRGFKKGVCDLSIAKKEVEKLQRIFSESESHNLDANYGILINKINEIRSSVY